MHRHEVSEERLTARFDAVNKVTKELQGIMPQTGHTEAHRPNDLSCVIALQMSL
ncbi:MAG: hypothetical protein V7746_25655 [Halioglobus sp.]